jgi:hypothetical protein
LRAPLIDRCNGQSLLSISRTVTLPGSGEYGARLIVGGTLRLHVTSPLGVVGGMSVDVFPDGGTPRLDPRAPTAVITRLPSQFAYQRWCGGRTDSEGRLTLNNFPPGPARVQLRLPNSTYVRRVSVPEHDERIPLTLPDGIVPVHVVDANTNRAVANAAIAWNGGGARVEAVSTATGDALLESTGSGPGTLEVIASGFELATAKLDAAPAEPFRVALTPEPPASLDVQVVTAAGEPVGGAVVSLFPRRAQSIGRIGVADAKGVARFSTTPQGPFEVLTTAAGFAPSGAAVPRIERSSIVVTVQPQR